MSTTFGKHAVNVPDDPVDNMRWRAAVLTANRKEQRAIVKCCEEDMLFFFKTFMWGHDPRGRMGIKVMPFIPFQAQVPAIEALYDSFGRSDVAIEKSRDMGATWINVGDLLWGWRLIPYSDYLILARNEDQVDKPGSMKSIMEKMRFTVRQWPKWFRPQVEWPKLRIRNLDNNAVIDGSSTVGDAGRGDRKTKIFIDEAASITKAAEIDAATADATDNRVWNSTPKGTANHYYKVVQNPGVRKIRLHWSDHPTKSMGLYRATDRGVRHLDSRVILPQDYPYIRDGRMRSIWYDREWVRRGCDRDAEQRRIMAQEVDLDYEASDHVFFGAELISVHVADHARKPLQSGEVMFDDQSGEFMGFDPRPDGRLQLWVPIDETTNRPAEDERYVMGIDISFGTGSSNSAIRVWSRDLRQLVASWKCPNTAPERLAPVAYAIGTWFGGNDTSGQAKAIWEANGPGRAFGAALWKDLQYANVYWRRPDEIAPGGTKGRREARKNMPGFWNRDENMGPLFSAAKDAISAGRVSVRDEWSLKEEYSRFIIVPNKLAPQHATTESPSPDPTKARLAHGDTVTADMLALKIVLEDDAKHRARERRWKQETGRPEYDMRLHNLIHHPDDAEAVDSLGPGWE